MAQPFSRGTARRTWDDLLGRARAGTGATKISRAVKSVPFAFDERDVGPWKAGLAPGIIGSVFVSEGVTVAMPFRQTSPRLLNLISSSGLAKASHAAYDDGVTALIRVGPSRTTPLSAKLVRVRFLEPLYTTNSVRIGLRWEATGPAAGLFPVLDADIALAQSGEQECTLTLSGTYRPPLGRLGEELDRAMLGRVAAATIRALLENVSDALAHPPPEAQPDFIAEGTRRPAPEPGT